MRSHLLDRIPGIDHGFGDLTTPVPTQFLTDWEPKRPRWKQVHGKAFCEVVHAAQECGEVDALITRAPGIPIAAVSADCVPVLFAKRDGTAVASAHAGWRGTRARIVQEVWRHLASQGEKAADWVAAIGPAIGPCCYEVAEELAADFQREFGWMAVPSFRRLDLPLINAAQLREVGFSDVEILRACTHCALDTFGRNRFHSYRRAMNEPERKGTREYSVIRITSRS